LTKSYIINGEDTGVNRLGVLTRSTWLDSEVFLQQLGLSSPMKILEVGCGGGAITERLVETFKLTNKIVGIDFDLRAVEVVKKKNVFRRI